MPLFYHLPLFKLLHISFLLAPLPYLSSPSFQFSYIFLSLSLSFPPSLSVYSFIFTTLRCLRPLSLSPSSLLFFPSISLVYLRRTLYLPLPPSLRLSLHPSLIILRTPLFYSRFSSIYLVFLHLPPISLYPPSIFSPLLPSLYPSSTFSCSALISLVGSILFALPSSLSLSPPLFYCLCVCLYIFLSLVIEYSYFKMKLD